MQLGFQHKLDVRLDEQWDDSVAPSRLRFKDVYMRNDDTLFAPSRASFAYSTLPVPTSSKKQQQQLAFWQLNMPNST